MKTLQFIILAAGLLLALLNPAAIPAQPLPFLSNVNENFVSEVKSLNHQLAALISYPQILGEQGGITMISFQISSKRITKVKVYSQSEALNRHITLCLTGKKIQMPENRANKEQMARIHFLKA